MFACDVEVLLGTTGHRTAGRRTAGCVQATGIIIIGAVYLDS